MPQYLFVFGRDPGLSAAELGQYFRSQNKPWAVDSQLSNAFLVSSDIDPSVVISDLGGTVKIAKILATLSHPDPVLLTKALESSDLANPPDKFFYGFSFFGAISSEERAFFSDYFKQKFKQLKVKAMFRGVKSHGKPNQFSLGPTQIHSRSLLGNGFDFCIAKTDGQLLVGQTVASTDPREIISRDRNRRLQTPVAALSIRLARILVNLAGLSAGKTVLDPFCGVGTVLAEAAELGLNGIGIDHDETSIRMAKKNLDRYSKQVRIELRPADATDQSAYSGSFDAVVTEPDLGPYFTRLPSQRTAKQEMDRLVKLYDAVFRTLSTKIAPGQRIVIVFPKFKTLESQIVTTPESVFRQNGFESTNPLENTLFDGQFPYLYESEGNKIQRLIYVLKKTGSSGKPASKPQYTKREPPTNQWTYGQGNFAGPRHIQGARGRNPRFDPQRTPGTPQNPKRARRKTWRQPPNRQRTFGTAQKGRFGRS